MASGPSSEPRDPRPEDVESALLGSGELEVLGLLRNSSNYTFLARVGPAGPSQLLAVYKPAAGESPLWDFPPETLYRREVAAYRLARALGWPRVPPTVVHPSGPHGVGSLQLYIDGDLSRNYLTGDDDAHPAWLPISLFDVISNNADRKAGHCIFDRSGEVWVIDHGLTFNSAEKLRTVIWDFAGRPLPASLRSDLERVEEGIPGIDLDDLLAPAEIRALRRRLRAVLDPRWRFPAPTSGWSVPWPPV